MTKNADMIISKGRRYKNNDSDEVVIVFHVDNARSSVRYSPESGATGREYSADLDDFRKNFSDAGEAPVEKASTK